MSAYGRFDCIPYAELNVAPLQNDPLPLKQFISKCGEWTPIKLMKSESLVRKFETMLLKVLAPMIKALTVSRKGFIILIITVTVNSSHLLSISYGFQAGNVFL